MDVIAEAVIPRHCVVRNAAKLSPMQAAAIASHAVCSLVSAPTGAGKSYVYQYLLLRGERILFVAPTRRLVQALAREMRQALIFAGVSLQMAQRRVDIFTSDEAARMRAEGFVNIVAWRLAQVPGQTFGDHGEIIFTTPEAVSWLLLHSTVRNGLGDVGPATLMTAFDRIVFDELHLIQPRGFGLFAVLARLAQDGPWRIETGRTRARLSGLSATLLDIAPVMRRLGVKMSDADLIQEQIVADGDRALHGDVTVRFVRSNSLADIAEQMRGELDKVVKERRTAAIIYDALCDLQAEKPRLRQVAKELRLDVADDGLFFDNSLDAQIEADDSGRHKDISRRKLLVSTSTIEVGVTLPNLVLLIIDPGFSVLSLMQRIGRVARGDFPGTVVIRVTDEALALKPWLQSFKNCLASCGGRIGIGELVAFAAKLAQVSERFALPKDDLGASGARTANEIPASTAVPLYGALSMRAVYNAAVYWHLLEKSLRDKGSGLERQADAVLACAPDSVAVVRAWLARIARLEGGKTWISAYLAEAAVLRDFAPTVRVIDRNGVQITASAAWLAKQTTIYNHGIIEWDGAGETLIRVDSFDWPNYMRAHGDPGTYVRRALLPYCGRLTPVIRNPVQIFQDAARRQAMTLAPGQRDAIWAAADLVGCTGIIPYDDSQADADAHSGIL